MKQKQSMVIFINYKDNYDTMIQQQQQQTSLNCLNVKTRLLWVKIILGYVS